jgi:hypothetical protein
VGRPTFYDLATVVGFVLTASLLIGAIFGIYGLPWLIGTVAAVLLWLAAEAAADFFLKRRT